tara:strand:- start:54 stop:377 length:324 start_codon:yes stop_codon:yes gene_type:complete
MKGKLNQPVVCADGFRMSVQANANAYCEPQKNNANRYESVEVGYPSVAESLLIEFAEEPEHPTGTVYPRVPAALVSLVIAKHGGMISGEVPPGVAELKAIVEGEENV